MTAGTTTVIAVSAGDPQGIGPEITRSAVLALGRADARVRFRIHSFGGDGHERDEWESWKNEGRLVEIEHPWSAADRLEAPPSRKGGAASLAAFRAAAEDVIAGRADALCTAPLAKEAVALVEADFRGHTGWLSQRTGAEALMCLASKALRVMLLTEHLPLERVASALTVDLVRAKLELARTALREDLNIPSPRIALLALNPHAGEGGLIGDEETRVLEPALKALGGAAEGFEGPFPADGFFRPGHFEAFDAVMACYHDQGLIPLKLLSGGQAVNISFGLPIVRTSPDHGTAFDIAGRGLADPSSMMLALESAVEIARRRRGAGDADAKSNA
jgi:4-hydroxythreonine-4-phosphate dehydrogenase